MARTKSEDKRREIIRVAAQAFEELGYERTSMLTIAERMSGSKQTLYNYFPSKEDLLRAVLADGVGEAAEASVADFMAEASKSLRKALMHAGTRYLAHQLAPSTIALFRTVAGLPADSKDRAEFFEYAIRSAWNRVAKAFEMLMREGKMRRADPWLAAMHFKGLVLQDLLERQLLGASKANDPKEFESAAKNAADAFLQIYGADDSSAKGKSRG